MQHISVTLDAVIVTVTNDVPRILLVESADDTLTLPSGPIDDAGDETLELGLRRTVSAQTGVDITYVEQLYTFGDRHRRAGQSGRELAIGYVALTDEASTTTGSRWVDMYDLFPWEDRRTPDLTTRATSMAAPLLAWSAADPEREARVHINFGIGMPWDPIRVLERYELLYESGLVAEGGQGSGAHGIELRYDHRRIAATALGRLRGKLTYRPVIFEVMPECFTLTQLQDSVEAIIGIELHKQNFRRIVERGDLVEQTDDFATDTGGRPAALYRFRSDVVSERPRPGFPLPRPKNL